MVDDAHAATAELTQNLVAGDGRDRPLASEPRARGRLTSPWPDRPIDPRTLRSLRLARVQSRGGRRGEGMTQAGSKGLPRRSRLQDRSNRRDT